jgi:magnesium-transporting ATPase (P-type)
VEAGVWVGRKVGVVNKKAVRVEAGKRKGQLELWVREGDQGGKKKGRKDKVRKLTQGNVENVIGSGATIVMTGDVFVKVLESSSEGAQCLLDNLDAVGLLGRCTPEQKRAFIRVLKKSRGVMMVGDGCNDVLAMEEADVGVGIMGGFGGTGQIKGEDEDEDGEEGVRKVLKRVRKTRQVMIEKGVDKAEAGQAALVAELKRRSDLSKGGVTAARALVGSSSDDLVIKETGGSLNGDFTSLVPSVSVVGSLFDLSLTFKSGMRQTVIQEVRG